LDISKFFSTFAQNFDKMKQLTGLGTALITPFTASGDVDYPALERLIDQQIQGGIDYLVVLGTTGEAATLSLREKVEIVRFITSRVNHRLPLVLGVGGNSTYGVLGDLSLWNELLTEHFAAILSVCPYYNKPSQEGLYQHFCAVAKVSDVPVILYNVPGRTGVNLLPETVMRIYEAYPRKIIGVKEASGNMEQIKKLIDLAQNTNLLIISGDDGIAAQVMTAGGSGLISVAANAWPREFGRIVREKDEDLQQRFAKMVALLFKEGNPSGIKTVLNLKELIDNQLRLPLVPNSEVVQHEIEKEIASLE